MTRRLPAKVLSMRCISCFEILLLDRSRFFDEDVLEELSSSTKPRGLEPRGQIKEPD